MGAGGGSGGVIHGHRRGRPVPAGQPGQEDPGCGGDSEEHRSRDHLAHLTASFGRIDLGPDGALEDVEQGRGLIETEDTSELWRGLQSGGPARIEGNHHESWQHGETGLGRPVGRGHRLEVVLDFIDGFPGRGQCTAQVEEELL